VSAPNSAFGQWPVAGARADLEYYCIEIEVNFRDLGWVAFKATATDTLPHARKIWTRLAAGEACAVTP
jgi:hypothetical protein